jgi:1-deoxy-D-xylulose-5-phosphate reductoisomerase
MGKKITVDSASMMNKGLELIEAMHLFDLPPERIDVVIHKESIVHSMVEFIDHSVVAQLGIADMRLPIQYALTWPARTESLTPSADLCRIGCLHFALPDEENFRCLPLARRVASMPSSAAAAMNGANEAAVAAFLNGKLSFPGIAEVCEHVVSNTDIHECSDIRDVLETDREARAKASEYVAGR